MKTASKTIVAKDGNGDLVIEVSFSSEILTKSEVGTVVREACRDISSVIAGLPFTDYGIDNTRIKATKRD